MKDVGNRPQSMSYWLRSASWGTERPPLSVHPQCPLLPRRVTTEALFRVSFKKTDHPYYQLLKTGIWVMAWDFIGILFLLLLIILQWVARPFLGVGAWGRGERRQSTPGALRQAASHAYLPEQQCTSSHSQGGLWSAEWRRHLGQEEVKEVPNGPRGHLQLQIR